MSAVVQQDPQLMEVNPPLLQGNPDLHTISQRISEIVEPEIGQTPMKYWITLGVTSSITVLLTAMLRGGARLSNRDGIRIATPFRIGCLAPSP